MCVLTWAITSLADSTAALVMSTDTPRLQLPCSSGGLTMISATSIAERPVLNSPGTCDRKIGV